jgi:hypothetical protein
MLAVLLKVEPDPVEQVPAGQVHAKLQSLPSGEPPTPA